MKNTRNSRRIWSTMLISMTLAVASGALHAQVSLSTVIDLAQKHSTQVRMAEADLNKARAVYSQTKDVFVPSVQFSSGLPVSPSVGFMGTPSSIFSATAQSLVISIPYKDYLKAGSSGIKAAILNLKDVREQVAFDASSAYIELDTVKSLLKAAHEQEDFTSRLIQIQQERSDAGIVPVRDLFQAKLTAAEIRLKRLHLETRSTSLEKQLAALTGLPIGSIIPDHASIPEIPAIKADETQIPLQGIQAAQMIARSKQLQAKGDRMYELFPQMAFAAQYNRNTSLLNDAQHFYNDTLPTNNFSAGVSIQIPLFDLGHHAKARESAAEALKAAIEVEQAQHQNEFQIAQLTATLNELDTLAEIASLKQQIATDQLKTVRTQLESGVSGTGAPQLTPKDEQLAQIDERQKYTDAIEAGFSLSKARLGLIRALGHMDDWLAELRQK